MKISVRKVRLSVSAPSHDLSLIAGAPVAAPRGLDEVLDDDEA